MHTYHEACTFSYRRTLRTKHCRKTRLNWLLKNRQTKDLKEDDSLMKVKSIPECSLWSILQYFDLH